jgi:hypothetical protein
MGADVKLKTVLWHLALNPSLLVQQLPVQCRVVVRHHGIHLNEPVIVVLNIYGLDIRDPGKVTGQDGAQTVPRFLFTAIP